LLPTSPQIAAFVDVSCRQSLDVAEDQATRTLLEKQRHVFPSCKRVYVPKGSFIGVAQGGDAKSALIYCGDRFWVKIATVLLHLKIMLQSQRAGSYTVNLW